MTQISLTIYDQKHQVKKGKRTPESEPTLLQASAGRLCHVGIPRVLLRGRR